MYVVRIFDELKTSITNNSNDIIYRLSREFLSNFSSFIDYWEKRISKDFGKNSDQSKTFKDSTHKEFSELVIAEFPTDYPNNVSSMTVSIREFPFNLARHFLEQIKINNKIRYTSRAIINCNAYF